MQGVGAHAPAARCASCHPQFKRCESLPNKKQLYATIARLVKQPAQKLAVGIKQVRGAGPAALGGGGWGLAAP
jgi:hypothetical protein